MSRYGKKNGIPDRWLDYSCVGKRLAGTRFIAFKVPLKQTLSRLLPPEEVFGPWELLDSVTRQNQDLGIIIDLTFTTRYYSLQDLPDSLQFLKIFTAGHEIPSNATILSFKRAVRSFLRDNADNDKLIGVHCTHGLNRTGYLVCRYLIDVDLMDPREAVELFNSSRGHDQERKNYLEDLKKGPRRSNEGMEESEQEPMRGLAVRRPGNGSVSEDRPPPPTKSCSPRSWSSRGPPQQRRNPHPEETRSKNPPQQSTRSKNPPRDDKRSRNPPRQDPRSRNPPREETRSRNPPREETRSRYPPWEDNQSRYPPWEDSRSRYPPWEGNQSRYPPQEDPRSRYPPWEDNRSRYPPREDPRSRYPPREDPRSRYPPREDPRSRYPPREDPRSRYPPSEQDWRIRPDGPTSHPKCPPVLPPYCPTWSK